ncbi:anaphase-promoting complex subunit cdc27 [Dispira parvispora]|uniref:Anaphase-promoting complex subunit cdc27 n=1 Tax=Dispira parvispora TaxID=1520584 RepID=A0A9W8ATG7_9FUNG|nr:anaphase-promoting complex subunit cdc27 [Dispira parvispora]
MVALSDPPPALALPSDQATQGVLHRSFEQYVLASCSLQLWNNALFFAEQWFALEEDNPRALGLLALCYHRQRQPQAGYWLLTQHCTKLDLTNTSQEHTESRTDNMLATLYYLCQLCVELRRWPEAESHLHSLRTALETQLERDPRPHPENTAYRGERFIDVPLHNLPVHNLLPRPTLASVYFLLGHVYMHTNRPTQAQDLLTASLAHDPYLWCAWYDLYRTRHTLSPETMIAPTLPAGPPLADFAPLTNSCPPNQPDEPFSTTDLSGETLVPPNPSCTAADDIPKKTSAPQLTALPTKTGRSTALRTSKSKLISSSPSSPPPSQTEPCPRSSLQTRSRIPVRPTKISSRATTTTKLGLRRTVQNKTSASRSPVAARNQALRLTTAVPTLTLPTASKVAGNPRKALQNGRARDNLGTQSTDLKPGKPILGRLTSDPSRLTNASVLGRPPKSEADLIARRPDDKKRIRVSSPAGVGTDPQRPVPLGRAVKNNTVHANLEPPMPSVTKLVPEKRSRVGSISTDHAAKQSVASQFLYSLVTTQAQVYQKVFRYECRSALQILHGLPQELRLMPRISALYGRMYLELGQYEQSERYFRWAWEHAPYRVEDMEMYSTLLWHTRQLTTLGYMAHRLVSTHRLAPQTWCAVGNYFSLQQEHARALRCFERAIQLDATFAYAQTLAGHEYVAHQQEWDRAQTCFRLALQLDPNHYSAWYGLGMVYYQTEQGQLAEYHFQRAQELYPHNAILLCCLGMVQEKMGGYEKALEYYQEAIQVVMPSEVDLTVGDPTALPPQLLFARFKKAKALVQLTRYLEALHELESLTQLVPNEANLYFLAGQIHQHLSQNHQAMLCYSWALDLDPHSVTAITEAMEQLKLQLDDEHSPQPTGSEALDASTRAPTLPPPSLTSRQVVDRSLLVAPGSGGVPLLRRDSISTPTTSLQSMGLDFEHDLEALDTADGSAHDVFSY